MKDLSLAEIYWMEQVALGPFSYLGRDETDIVRLTHTGGCTICASTYRAMLANRWVKEDIS